MANQTQLEVSFFWPLILYITVVFFIAILVISTSYLLGQKHANRNSIQPYESGIASTGSVHQHLSIKFYLIALFFVIFDLEAAFIFAWAISIYELGWMGYLEILFFITILLSSLVYLWRLGALDWGFNTSLARKNQHHA